jgi:hypothetical protein
MSDNQKFSQIYGQQLTSIGLAVESLVDKIVEERLRDALPKCTIISVRAAAERYDVAASTIYTWMETGVIRKHIVGGRVYCFVEDFETPKGLKTRIWIS